MTAASILALNSASFGQAVCGSSANDCCLPGNGTPGCNDVACCQSVCAADPFCCNVAWDTLCANAAVANCAVCESGSTCPPSGNDCCVAGSGPGCNDTTCCEQICAADPFCCNNTWDQLCANAAVAGCAVCEGGGGPCGNSANDCCFSGSGPGCSDAACCELVCSFDPFCCNNTWDGICASEANANCPELCGSGGGCEGSQNDCCVPSGNGTPGCNDAECCAAICAADPFCCSVQWDGLCSGAAAAVCVDLCGIPCDTSCPPGGDAEDEACGDDTNGGCNSPTGPVYEAVTAGVPKCGTFWADGNIRDTDWFSFSLAAPANVTWSVTSGAPLVLALLDQNCPPFIFEIVGISGCPSEITFCLPEGDFVAFVALNTFNGIPCGTGDVNNYVALLTVGETCAPLGCGTEGTEDCCVPHATPFCNDEECCQTICAADPFCCSVQWDGLCSNAALIACAVCESDCDVTCPSGSASEGEACGDDTNGGCNAPPTSGSDCCVAHPSIGCDDPTCQDIICALDPFCCSVQWDGICAAEAAANCGKLCAIVPNYEAIDEGTICGTFWADGNIRDTDWYSFSIDETTLVTWSVFAKVPVVIGLLDSNCPPFIFTLIGATDCPSEVSFCLDAGTYTAFIAPNFFTGLPCGTGEKNNYVATLSFNGPCEALGCGSPQAEDCCVPHATPFCSDEECCTAICAADPFCCSVQWDGLCSGAALAQCAVCQFGTPGNDECDGATAVVVGANAVSTQGATGQTDLPPESCLSFGSSSNFNDVWYTYVATGTGTTTVSTCNTVNFDTRLAVFTGPCDDLTFLACNDDGPGCAGFSSLMTFEAVCGTTYTINLGAFTPGVTGTGTMTITQLGNCPVACTGDLDLDGDVDAADLAILLGQWGGPGSGDLDGSGSVTAADLAILLGAWGDCP